MKIIALTLFAGALALAQNSTTPTTVSGKRADTALPASSSAGAKPPQTPSRAKAAPPRPAPSIPAGATEIEPNLFRFTDSSGNTRNYRRTPFGVSKWQEDPSAAASKPVTAQAETTPVVVTDLGDSYRFEKKTPFGGATWTRKKSQLTNEEKQLVKPAEPATSPDGSHAVSKVTDTK